MTWAIDLEFVTISNEYFVTIMFIPLRPFPEKK